uniref:Vp91 n=1 Tax=Cnaphalocrocis medinalis granulovirus TaxID=1750712 RepID=A0A0X9FL22_9BBAC|nr:vp91 [Cnaphalocrocis medinalis granulovirus]
MSFTSLLVVIVLIFAVILFYYKFIIDDFNNDSYSVRLNVLKEYLRTIGDDNTVPAQLGYVSDINDTNHTYTVTYFDTTTLKLVSTHEYDESNHVFNFETQSVNRVWNNNPQAASVSRVSNDEHVFLAHADDGDLLMSCKNGKFVGDQCVPAPVCDQPNVKLPLTEHRLNMLVFNRLAAQSLSSSSSSSINEPHHPTAYVQCDHNSEPSIVECLNGESFVNTQCVYQPSVVTNGGGVVMMPAKELLLNTKSVSSPSLLLPHNKILAKNKKFVYYSIPNDNNNNKTRTSVVTSPIINLSENTINISENIETIMPVNYEYAFDATPCIDKEVGHTFRTTNMGVNQYLECISNNNLFLHSCKENIKFDDETQQYRCDHNNDCDQFEDGTGVILNSIHNDNVMFHSGKTKCVNYRVVDVTECDTSNFVTKDFIYHPLMKITPHVGLPRQIYDADSDQCVDYDLDKLTINNNNFAIEFDTHSELITSVVGQITKIPSSLEPINVADCVVYARDLHETCVNPHNGAPIDCIGVVTHDILNNETYNLCDESGAFVEQVRLKPNEFVRKGELVQLSGYTGECRYMPGTNYLKLAERTVSNYRCLFTIPLV